jgi:hypothetical protein
VSCPPPALLGSTSGLGPPRSFADVVRSGVGPATCDRAASSHATPPPALRGGTRESCASPHSAAYHEHPSARLVPPAERSRNSWFVPSSLRSSGRCSAVPLAAPSSPFGNS